MSRPHQLVCMHAAFYNVGMQSAQLDAATQRHEEHMRRLENDLSAIVRSVPDLVALHLCEFGGHGAVVPEHVRQRVARVVGSDWSVVWHITTMFCFGNQRGFAWLKSLSCNRCRHRCVPMEILRIHTPSRCTPLK